MRQLVSGEATAEQGLTAARDAAARFKNEPLQPTHFVFGKMSPEE